MTVPQVTVEQADQLRRIEPTQPGVYPCQAVLKDGRVVDRVLVIAAGNFAPEGPPERRTLLVEDVTEFRESPYRVPAHLSRKASEFGESGMGYMIFTLILSDGRRLPYSPGGYVDFLELPPDVRSEMIVDLLPDVGREEINRNWGNRFMGPADCFVCPFVFPPRGAD